MASTEQTPTPTPTRFTLLRGDVPPGAWRVLRSPVPADALVVDGGDALAAGDGVVGCWLGGRVEHWDDEPPGLAQFAFVAALAGLDRAEFRRRYLTHAPVARVQHPAICRYAQCFVTAGTDDDCWAVAELHFADETSMRERFYADVGSPAVVDADIAGYLDRRRTWSVVAVPPGGAPS